MRLDGGFDVPKLPQSGQHGVNVSTLSTWRHGFSSIPPQNYAFGATNWNIPVWPLMVVRS
jgi:hypothetical protein